MTLLGIGTLGATADPAEAGPGQGNGQGSTGGGGRTWQTDVDAGGQTLYNLGALEMADNPTGITDFAGGNLRVDDQGVLFVHDGPGSGLDADTIDGTDLQELEDMIMANRRFVESNASALTSALEDLEHWINQDIQSVESSLNDRLATIEGTIDDLVGSVEAGFGTVAGTFEDISNFLGTEIVDGLNGVLGDIQGAFDSLADVVNNTLNPLASAVESTFGDVDDALTSVESDVNGVIDDIEGGIESAANAVVSEMNDAIETANKFLVPTSGKSGPVNTIPEVSVNLGSINVPPVAVTLPPANFGAPTIPQIPDPPMLDLPDAPSISISLPKVTFPTVSLPKPDDDFDDFQS